MRKRKYRIEKEPVKDSGETQGKKSLFEKLKDSTELITTLTGIGVALYSFINYMFVLTYQVECEKYYNIPRTYFSTSIKNSLLYLGIMIFLCAMVFIVPFLIRQNDAKKDNNNKNSFGYAVIFSVVYGLTLGIISSISMINILEVWSSHSLIISIIKWLDTHTDPVLFFIYLSSIIAVVGITFIKDIQKRTSLEVQKIFAGIITICFCANILVIVGGTTLKFSESIEDKTKYEIITNQNEKLIVITEIDKDNIIVAPYSVINDKEGKIFQIDTSQYKILNKLNLQFAYIDLGVPHKIIKTFTEEELLKE